MENEIIALEEESEDFLLLDRNKLASKLDGVVIGILMGLSEKGIPLVAFPGNESDTGISAHSTTLFKSDDIGCQVALLFEGGDPQRPIVIGRIQQPRHVLPNKRSARVELDGERFVIKAEKEIVLRCGKSSITLTKAGKIIIRGAYLLSRSSGVNRIKGGSVHIN